MNRWQLRCYFLYYITVITKYSHMPFRIACTYLYYDDDDYDHGDEDAKGIKEQGCTIVVCSHPLIVFLIY